MWQDASSSTVQMSRKDAGPRILWPRGKHSIVEQVSLKLWGRDSTKGASSKRYPSHNRIWTRHVNKLGTQTRLQECANTSNYKKDNTHFICALRHKKKRTCVNQSAGASPMDWKSTILPTSTHQGLEFDADGIINFERQITNTPNHF